MTPEQHLRRALIDNVPRDQVIEAIARHLFKASRTRGFTHGSTPRDWYRVRFMGMGLS